MRDCNRDIVMLFWSKGCILDGPLVNHVGFHAAVFLGFGQGISVAQTQTAIQTIRYRQIVDTDWRAYLEENLRMQTPASPNPEPRTQSPK